MWVVYLLIERPLPAEVELRLVAIPIAGLCVARKVKTIVSAMPDERRVPVRLAEQQRRVARAPSVPLVLCERGAGASLASCFAPPVRARGGRR